MSSGFVVEITTGTIRKAVINLNPMPVEEIKPDNVYLTSPIYGTVAEYMLISPGTKNPLKIIKNKIEDKRTFNRFL